MEDYNDMKVYNNFNHYFANLTDNRQLHKIKHLLGEIIFITVLAVIAGADDFEEIARYAKSKRRWLCSFLKLPGGIPSHDTFNRVLCMVDSKEFESNFICWINDYKDQLQVSVNQEQEQKKEVIPVDGKTICNSRDAGKGKKAVHMVSAMSTKYGLVLGQKKCAEKSNEITAIPDLLQMIAIAGAIVTIDAMGCQKNIAELIISKGADYVLALKGNQGNLNKEVIDFFGKVEQREFKHYIYSQHTDIGKDHGRIETRECTTINNLGWLLETEAWAGIKSIVKIKATVIKDGKETIEDRYYISSLDGDAEQLNRVVRTHWHIENKLHWVLDVVFREDYCRLRTGNGAENMNIIRKIALNKMKADNSEKCSMKVKRKKCAWEDNYAAKILWNMMS